MSSSGYYLHIIILDTLCHMQGMLKMTHNSLGGDKAPNTTKETLLNLQQLRIMFTHIALYLRGRANKLLLQ